MPEPKPAQTRNKSPISPYLSLEDAISVVEKIYKKERRNSVPVAVVAQHAGYKDLKSSSAGRLLSTLKQYDLVEHSGSGEARHMKVSPRALDIILAEHNDSPERLAAIRHCALWPSIHERIFTAYPDELPSDATLRSFLIRSLDFNDDQVNSFIGKFRKTVDFAKLYDKNSTDNGLETPDDSDDEFEGEPLQRPKVGDFVQWTSNGVNQFNPVRKVVGFDESGVWAFVEGGKSGVEVSELTVCEPPRAEQFSESKRPPANPYFKDLMGDPPPNAIIGVDDGTEIERKALDEGSAVLQLPKKLSAESFDDLEYWIKGILKRAKRKAGIVNKPRGKDDPVTDEDADDE